MVSCRFKNPPVSKGFHSGYKSRSTLKSNFPAESRIYVFLKKKVLTNSVGDDKIICVAKRQQNALVAQLDRVSDYESEGQGFESLRARQIAASDIQSLRRFFYKSHRCVHSAVSPFSQKLTLGSPVQL